MNRRERLEKIQQVIEESLGLKWTDRIVFNRITKTYRTVDESDFWLNKPTYVHLLDNKKASYIARVEIGREKFIIKISGMTVDASEFWQEIIQETAVKV